MEGLLTDASGQLQSIIQPYFSLFRNIDGYPCRLVTDMLGGRLCDHTVFGSFMSCQGSYSKNEAFDFWYTDKASEALGFTVSRNDS